MYFKDKIFDSLLAGLDFFIIIKSFLYYYELKQIYHMILTFFLSKNSQNFSFQSIFFAHINLI